MSLQVNLSVSEKSASSVYVYDCTGSYSPDNTGGLGGINPKITDVQKATLRILVPGATEYVDINMTGDFPNLDEVPLELTPSMVKITGDTFTSGKYKFQLVYDVIIKGSVVTKTGYYVTVLTKDIECCLDKKVHLVNENVSTDEAQQQIVMLTNLLEIAKTEACPEIALYDAADKKIEYLNGQCKCSTC